MRRAADDKPVVAVIGDGLSGRAVVRSLIRRGRKIRLCALTPPEDEAWLAHLDQHDVAVHWGAHDPGFFNGVSEVIVSPGVCVADPVLQKIQASGIPCVSEILYARRLCRRPVVAVTGTCGKSTVATWIAHGLNQLGLRAVLCGNIGRPFTDAVEHEPDADVFVVEVSSFQMETAGAFVPDAAVFTSFSQNHLDRHGTLEQYFKLKARLFENVPPHGLAVLSTQHEWIKMLGQRLGCTVRYAQVVSGLSADRNGVVSGDAALVRPVLEWWGMTRGQWERIRSGLKGLAHRLEEVAEIDGRLFINDSKATSPLATIWALSQIRAPVILMCGGRDKHTRFEEVGDSLRDRTRCVVAYGEAADKIKAALEAYAPVVTARNLAAAFERAMDLSQAGDVVMLSPMCASFDEFGNYEERGRFFKDLVTRVTPYRKATGVSSRRDDDMTVQ